MKKLLKILTLCASGLVCVLPVAHAQYPEKLIRLVVPYPPGSGTDTVARYTARRLEGALGKPVIVENRVGGNAIIAAQVVINSPADGYTLLWAANGPVSTNVALYNKLPYDPLNDLVPVARVAYSPMGLYVPSASPYKTATELLDAAKRQPARLNYGSGSATYNIATEWLLSYVGAHANIISYKGSSQVMTDLAGGQIDFAIAEYSAGLPLVNAGKIRLLAMTSEKRMPNAPSTPTLQELGYKDFFQVAWWGVFAPKNTPKTAVSALEKALLEVYSDSESKEYLEKNNFSAFLGTAQELKAFQESEIKRESRLVEQFNIPKI